MSFKDKLKEFLRPDKEKIIIALILPYLSYFLPRFYGYLRGYIDYDILKLMMFSQFYYPKYIFINLMLAIIMYPFSCSIILLISYHKQKKLSELKKDKQMLLLTSAGIIIFNPLTIEMISFLILVLAVLQKGSIYGIPMVDGVLITEVMPNSVAQDLGLKPGLRRVEIETGRYVMHGNIPQFINKYGKLIRNTSDIVEVFNNVPEWNRIYIRFLGGESIGSYLGENKTYTKLGIKVRDRYGNEAVL